jgi:putative alpha-1,2-mannosidase
VLAAACLSLTVSAQNSGHPTKTPLEYANGLVGTAPLDQQKLIGNAPPPGEQLYSGFTIPSAMLPHASTRIGPINANLDVNYPAGVRAQYFYPNRMIYGFTTGADDGPTIMPIVGDFTVPPERSASVYDKAREKSSPGYYSAYLDDFHTFAEMSATSWTGIFRFTFPQSDKAHVLLDLGRDGGDIEVVDDHTVRGKSRDGRFFVAEFSRPFTAFGVFKQHPARGPNDYSMIGYDEVNPGEKTISGNFAGAYLRFATTQGEQVLVKVASAVSDAKAEARLQAEDPGWDFDHIRHEAEDAWAKKLDTIQLKGGTEKEKMLFYSCLYHSFASPQLVARKGEEFTAGGGK